MLKILYVVVRTFRKFGCVPSVGVVLILLIVVAFVPFLHVVVVLHRRHDPLGLVGLQQVVCGRLRLDRDHLLDVVIRRGRVHVGGQLRGRGCGHTGTAVPHPGTLHLGRSCSCWRIVLIADGRSARLRLGPGPARAAPVLGEPLHLQVLRHGQEGVELLLGDVDLASVHEIQHGHQVVIEDALEVEEGMLVRVPPEDCAEEGGAGSDDHFVCFYLVVVTHESHVEEVFLLSDVIE